MESRKKHVEIWDKKDTNVNFDLVFLRICVTTIIDLLYRKLIEQISVFVG